MQSVATTPLRAELAPHNHTVQFYEDERFLYESVADFVAQGLDQGEPAVLVCTEAHQRAFVRTLELKIPELRKVVMSGLLRFIDARAMLSLFMRDGMPDEVLVKQHVGEALALAGGRAPGKRIRAFGEMVDLLWRDGNSRAAIRLEELWNDLSHVYCFTLLCAYDITNFNQSSDIGPLLEVCDRHSHTVPAESYRDDWGAEEKQRALLRLQQRAGAFHAESEQRKALEQALRIALSARRSAEQDRSDILAQAQAARMELERTLLSHDLRTPLNAILNWTQVAGGKVDAHTLRQAIEAIDRHAQALAHALDGVTTSSLESGAVR
jgi:hypothetical protein